MKSRSVLPLILLLVSAAWMGAGFFSQGRLIWAVVLIPSILPGAFSVFQARGWASTLTLSAMTVLAVSGLWVGTLPLFFILGHITSLAAWDAQHFQHSVSQLDDPRGVEDERRKHYRVLGVVLSIGLGFSVLALNLQLRVGFFPALVLVIVLVISLKQLIQRGSGPSGSG